MAWRIGRFIRGTVDEDVADESRRVDVDAVFRHDRIAAALREVERNMIPNEPRPAPGWHEVEQRNWEA